MTRLPRRPPRDPVGDQVERESSEEYLVEEVLKPLAGGGDIDAALLDLLTLEELVDLLTQPSSGRGWTPRELCRHLDALFMSELQARAEGKQFVSWRESNATAFYVFERINSAGVGMRRDELEGVRCKQCWQRMEDPSGTGRRREYCSDKCRQRARRERKQDGDDA